MIFQRAFLCCVTITVLQIIDVKVEAYLNGCNGGYCFVISNFSNISELQDQSNARQRCQSIGTQLVEIRNKDIQDSLVDFIKMVYSQGLNGWNVSTNGQRSSQSSWFRLTCNRPSNCIGDLSVHNQSDPSYAYGYLKSTTTGLDLYASRPAYSMGFICAGLTDCSGGVTISGLCHKSFTEALSWYDARNRCLDAGGDLASFENITSNDGFKALNGSLISASSSYWIGIRREWWTWQNSSSDVRYSDWVAGHPINDVGRANSDCLCLSTTEWKWIECGCDHQSPFVCISVTPTTTTTRSTPSTASAIKTSSEATLAVVSKSNGVSTPTISSTATSYFTGNGTGSMDQHMGLSRGATIGIGVGVGVGGALVIAASIAAVILLQRRCPRKKKADAKVRRPHIPTHSSKVNNLRSDEMENPYAVVVPPLTNNNIVNTNADESSNQTSAVYAQLDIRTEPQSPRGGSVIIVPGKTKPSPGPKPRTTNV